jgi:uncharacterized protein (TIGR02391 family)
MRGQVLNLDILEDPNHDVPNLIYLDSSDWRIFLEWLSQDEHRVEKLKIGPWNVRLFKSLVNRHFGSRSHRTRQLRELGINLDSTNVRQSDEMFISEAQLVYFNNEPNSRQRAEMLALARRQAVDGSFSIISQHRGFWRIPLVDVYFIDGSNLSGEDDLPAEFDFFVDFNIHPKLRQAIGEQIDSGQRGQVLQSAIIALRDHVRNMSGLQDEGRNLMERAFKEDGSYLSLNPLTNDSHGNEQRGFKEMYCGAWTGLRNPIAHEGPNSQFIQERLPDKKTLVKYLSFLSILLERADGPMST